MGDSKRTGSVDWHAVKAEFMLPEGEVYLNAGTLSALPRCVYEKQTTLMRSAEANPTLVAMRRGKRPIWDALERAAAYLGADPRDVVFNFNVTLAVNQALACLPWERGDEIVMSSLEYPSTVNAARATAHRHGLELRTFDLPVQPASAQEMVDAVLGALGPKTRCVVLSHVTTGNGLVTPVELIAPRLRERGVRFVVDGAHAIGLLPVRLGETAIDLYAGNFHKWTMGPRGTGFLYVAREVQPTLYPHVVGLGGLPGDGPNTEWHGPPDHPFSAIYRPQGTLGFSAFLAVPEALAFRERIGEEAIRGRVRDLVATARRRLGDDLGLACLSPKPELNAGLIRFELPEPWAEATMDLGWPRNASWFHERSGGITLAIGGETTQPTFRVSPHIWILEEDIDRLAEVLSGDP